MCDSEDNELSIKHRKERKELQAKIQALKKTASKGDKKKKKEILEEIALLEIDLDKRQGDDLNLLNNGGKSDPTVDIAIGVENINTSEKIEEQPQRISKAQKRRDKKANEEKIRQAEILAQEELNINGPRQKELAALKNILKTRKLCIHSIPSDGDCLYNAIKHQLNMTGRYPYDVEKLRTLTADYIQDNKDTLIFYMTNPETNECLTDQEFDKYCAAIRSTPAWGGQIEIKALSNALKVPIEILQATGPPTIQGDGDYKGPNLVLTYHRHMYSLGEHYNSTKPFIEINSESDDHE